METLIKKGNKVTWRKKKMAYIGYEIIDDKHIHIEFNDHNPICFVAGDVEINKSLCNTVEEIITALN